MINKTNTKYEIYGDSTKLKVVVKCKNLAYKLNKILCYYESNTRFTDQDEPVFAFSKYNELEILRILESAIG